jgi:hypothetical protein
LTDDQLRTQKHDCVETSEHLIHAHIATEDAEARQPNSPKRLRTDLLLPPSRYQHDIDAMVHTAQQGMLPAAGCGGSLPPQQYMVYNAAQLPFEGHYAAGQVPLAPLSLHNGAEFGSSASYRQLSGRASGFPYSTLPALRACSSHGVSSAVPGLAATSPGLRLSRAHRSSEDDDPSWQPAPEAAAESSVTESDDLYMPSENKRAAAAYRKPRPVNDASKTGKGAAAGDVRARTTGGSSKYRGQ